MKYLIPIICILFIGCKSQNSITENPSEKNIYTKQSIHQFKVENISGETFDFSSLKGKKVMVVNTASKCGLTPQYEDLQNLYEKYKENNFIVVGFPANNFLSQEPGSNEKIKSFCTEKFGVTFPMMAKVSVKGKDKHPVYQFLTEIEKNGISNSKVSWNFQKYLVDENGYLVKYISPKSSPMSEDVINWIEGN